MSQRTHTCTSGTWHACLRGPVSLLIAVAVLVGGVSAAQAALTTGGCLAQKRAAWGNLRKCQAVEEGKQLRGKTAALAKCQTKFQDKLGKISAKAADKAVACRYRDNGDETVTDYDTGLQWEKKNSSDGVQWYGNPLDVDNQYTWSSSGTLADGAAFTDFLSKLNGSEAPTPAMPWGSARFAGHTDWRLPTKDELAGAAACSAGSTCIDPIFGPTVVHGYWSATTVGGYPNAAWAIYFTTGDMFNGLKASGGYVRAVRTGL